MKLFFISFLILSFFISCSNENEQFCNCLEASKKLNEIDKDASNIKRWKDLQLKKDQDCKSFELTPGNELKQLLKDCK